MATPTEQTTPHIAGLGGQVQLSPAVSERRARTCDPLHIGSARRPPAFRRLAVDGMV